MKIDESKAVATKSKAMTLGEYEELYDRILDLCEDADSFRFVNASAEEIEKCKWISAMLEAFNDVPRSTAQCIFRRHKVKFDCVEFISAH